MTIGFVDPERVDLFRAALEGDPEFRIAAKAMSEDILLQVGQDRCFVSIRHGDVPGMNVVTAGSFAFTESSLSISASTEIWAELLKAAPAPGYHDFTPAMAWHGLQLNGNIRIRHAFNRAISRMLSIFREVESGVTKSFSPRPQPDNGTIEPITGRYVYVELDSITYRVYFEEAGNPDGIPLVCQHTAGASNSQWRYLLNDPVVTAHYRVIAHDLPYHGKSLPPEGVAWWTQDYQLDETLGLDFQVAFAKALDLDRPAFIGASIGGMIASDLPWKFPGFFRAVIACEVMEYAEGWDAMIPALSDPYCRALTTDMSYCQAPGIPLQNIHENTWVNDQSAFGVHAGDVNYYANVHDLRDKLHLFDTARTAVYLMNGEYDLATPPAMAEALAAKIEGARAIALMGLGHFPHCEDYDLFKTYLHPVLAEIAKLS